MLNTMVRTIFEFEIFLQISFLTKMEDFQIFVSIHKICLNFANQISNLKMKLIILFSIVENLWTTSIMLGCGSKLTIFKFSFQYTKLAWIRVTHIDSHFRFSYRYYIIAKFWRWKWFSSCCLNVFFWKPSQRSRIQPRIHMLVKLKGNEKIE